MSAKYDYRTEIEREFAANQILAEFEQHWREKRVWHEPIKDQIRIAYALLRGNEKERDMLFLLGVTEMACRLPQFARREASRDLTERQVRRVLGAKAAKSKIKHERREVTQAKVKTFDRIVEMLDHMQVAGKCLGDCTRADLLRAAVQAETSAGEATLRAAMYRELATIVGKGTVREAQNRGQVVALLTTTFKEPV